MSKPRVLAPLILKMLREGAGNEEIHAALQGNFSTGSIRTTISNCRKSLGLSDRIAGRAPRFYLSSRHAAALRMVAEEYKVSVNTLVSRIVETVVDDDLFPAILDHERKEMVIPWPFLPK